MYITRNYDYTGKFHLTHNLCYDNGINGLVVHKSHNAYVEGNVVFGNGRVSKDIEGRQDAGGIVIHTSTGATFKNNIVTSAIEGDFAYQCFGGTCDHKDEGGNLACPSSTRVNKVFTGVVKADECSKSNNKLTDYVSTMAADPQYTYLYYPCTGKKDGDSCIACNPNDVRGCKETTDKKICVGVYCKTMCDSGTISCHKHATCQDGKDGGSCVCGTGYEGDGNTCTDTDECTKGTHDCASSATCTNTEGSFTCTCKSGFSGDGKTCTDIDECSIGTDDCHPYADCKNNAGSFTCSCRHDKYMKCAVVYIP